MNIFRKAGRAFGKANMAVAKATTPSWRRQQQQLDPDFAGRDNVVNLRAEKDKKTYDVVIDDSGIHVGYQDKRGTTRWRKAMDVVGEVNAIDTGSPPSPKNPNRVWARTYKTSGGNYTGLNAQVKHLNDLGYNVQALDKRPAKAWRKGDVDASDKFIEEALVTKKITGDADFFGPYIDPKQAHSTADREFRTEFFKSYKPASTGRGFIRLGESQTPYSADKTRPESNRQSWRKGPVTVSSKEVWSTDQTRPKPKTEERTEARQLTGAVYKPEEAISQGESIDLGNGVRLVKHATSAGHKSLFTGRDGRTFVAVEDSKGRRSYFYQSFAGTSGKDQGRWYPTGGLAVDKTGDAWVIKGNPVKDKAFGRPELADLEDYLNSVLPHSDQDTDTFFQKHGYSYGDIHAKHEKAPNFNVDSFNRTGGKHDSKVLDAIVNQWKQEYLNKIWGKRGERPVNSNVTTKNPSVKQTPLRQAIHLPDESGPITYTGPAKPWRSSVPLKQIAEAPEYKLTRLREEINSERDDDRLTQYKNQTAELAKTAAGENARSINAGKGAKELTEQQIVSIQDTLPVPNIEDMDVMPDTVPKQDMTEQVNNILAMANAQSDISRKLVDKNYRASETPGVYESRPVSKSDNDSLKEITPGNFGYGYQFDPFEFKGDIQLEGAERLAEIFQGDFPHIADNFKKMAENQRKQKEISLAIKNTSDPKEKAKLDYAKDKLISENLNQRDAQRLLGIANRPIEAGGVSFRTPAVYEHTGNPKYTEETLKAWDKYSGQGNKSTVNTHVPGGRNEIVESRIRQPNATYNERLEQVRSVEQQIEPELFDEMGLESYLATQKRDLTDEQITQGISQPAPTDSQYDPVADLAENVATRLAGLRGLVEANYMASAGIAPSQAGTNPLGSTAAPYVRKNAEQRMGAMQENIANSQAELFNHYFDSLTKNPPQELAALDANTPPEQMQAAVRSIAENIIRQALVKDIQDQASNTARTTGEPPNSLLSRISNDRSLLRKFGLITGEKTGTRLRPEEAVIKQILGAANSPDKSIVDTIDDILLPNRSKGDPTYSPDEIANTVAQDFANQETERFNQFLSGGGYDTQLPPQDDSMVTKRVVSAKLADDADEEEANMLAETARENGFGNVQYNPQSHSLDFEAPEGKYTTFSARFQRFLAGQNQWFNLAYGDNGYQSGIMVNSVSVPVQSAAQPQVQPASAAVTASPSIDDLVQTLTAQTPKQSERFVKNVLRPEIPGKNQHSLKAGDLNIGDTFTDKSGGENFEVVNSDQDSGVVVLEDGDRYGTVALRNTDDLYVRKLKRNKSK